MAVHVAELYAALVAQRRQVFDALRDVSPAKLHEDIDLDQLSVLGTLVHVAQVERHWVGHVLRGRPPLKPSEFVTAYLDGDLTLEAVERAMGRLAAETRDYIRTEKPYELVLPRRDLGDLDGTPEQVLWHVMLHEMGHMGELMVARRRLGIWLPDLAPMDHLRRNPELGRWWMAEQY